MMNVSSEMAFWAVREDGDGGDDAADDGGYGDNGDGDEDSDESDNGDNHRTMAMFALHPLKTARVAATPPPRQGGAHVYQLLLVTTSTISH